MNVPLRQWADRLFTLLALASVAAIVLTLVVILLPMMWRGGSAVVFRGTVEFRRLQAEQFNRGNGEALAAEKEQTAQVRRRAYEILDQFAAGMDATALAEETRSIHREFKKQLENRNLPDAETAELTKASKAIRDDLTEALEAKTSAAARSSLDKVLSQEGGGRFKGTVASRYFDIARLFRTAAGSIDFRRPEYMAAVKEVREELAALLGPRPGESLPALTMQQYGATRWGQAQEHLDRLLWSESWQSDGKDRALKAIRVSREEQFAGTPLAALFPYMRDNAQAMLRPQWTFYWQYFLDDNISGHYFGGVGPEILGTLLITLLAIAIALPLGVVSAAYLVECATDSVATRVLRTCINTLAGVPSIVFGLFGLALFVVYMPQKLPWLGMPAHASILAGAFTLALLVLPVMIRASEESIRTVPRTYREAALALGASRLRCFAGVTLPAALPGILTGLILSMSRAAGETAPILLCAGIAMGPVPGSLTQPTRTLSFGSWDMAVGDKMAMLVPHNQFGMVMTLVGIVLLLNIVAIVIRGRLSRKLRGH